MIAIVRKSQDQDFKRSHSVCWLSLVGPVEFSEFFARLEIRIASAADPETSKDTSEFLSAVGVGSSRYLIWRKGDQTLILFNYIVSYLTDLTLLEKRETLLLKRWGRLSLGAVSSLAWLCSALSDNILYFTFTCSQTGTSPMTGVPLSQSRPIGEKQQQKQQHLRSLSPPTSLHMWVRR